MQGTAKDPGRVIFNFETKQIKEEFERMKALGAIVIKEPYDLQGMWIATLAEFERDLIRERTNADDSYERLDELLEKMQNKMWIKVR